MYCVTKSFLIGLPVLSVPFQSWVTPRSRSYAVASSEMQFVLKESCAYRKVHPPSAVGQFDSFYVPTASHPLVWTTVRLSFE